MSRLRRLFCNYEINIPSLSSFLYATLVEICHFLAEHFKHQTITSSDSTGQKYIVMGSIIMNIRAEKKEKKKSSTLGPDTI